MTLQKQGPRQSSRQPSVLCPQDFVPRADRGFQTLADEHPGGELAGECVRPPGPPDSQSSSGFVWGCAAGLSFSFLWHKKPWDLPSTYSAKSCWLLLSFALVSASCHQPCSDSRPADSSSAPTTAHVLCWRFPSAPSAGSQPEGYLPSPRLIGQELKGQGNGECLV